MIKQKKLPIRTCIACRQAKDKRELIRIVKNKEGEIKLDPTGKSSGRGAYVCKCESCFQLLKKKRLLNQTFKMEVAEEVYKKLEEEFNNVEK